MSEKVSMLEAKRRDGCALTRHGGRELGERGAEDGEGEDDRGNE